MKILVLAGGDSAEREVSLDSGQCVAAALRGLGHAVDLCDPCEQPVLSLNSDQWDIAFPMVHGTGGEDGVLQRDLSAAGFVYVGSSAAASELTFDKIRTNRLLQSHGIAVPESRIVERSTCEAAERQTLVQFAAFGSDRGGVVTKPPRQGSSIGVSIVQEPSQLNAALQLAFQYDDVCLVERFIAGREVTVPVIDGVAFPAIEIRPAATWYDYAAKYADDRTQYILFPAIPPSLSTTAVSACRLCDVTGIARVDFRIDSDDNAWLLEVNTIPGMTSHSLVPKSAAARGLTPGQLCESVILKALTRR